MIQRIQDFEVRTGVLIHRGNGLVRWGPLQRMRAQGAERTGRTPQRFREPRLLIAEQRARGLHHGTEATPQSFALICRLPPRLPSQESCERWRDQRDPGLSDRTGVPLSGKIWRGAHCPVRALLPHSAGPTVAAAARAYVFLL